MHIFLPSSRPDCIFEIHQLWQSGFCRVYSNCCCSCSFKPEIIKISQSSHKMYSNNIMNFQVSRTILNACTKKSENLLIALRCCEQSWTSPGGNTPQDTNCTATCLLSRKLFKLDEPDSRDELISHVLLWTPTHGRAKAGRPARTYIQQRCEDTGCCPEDLPEAMNDTEKWRERVRDIHATSTTWWWWWWCIIWFGLVWFSLVHFYGLVWFGLVWFTLMVWFGLVWFTFMAYQIFLVFNAKSFYANISNIRLISFFSSS